MGFPFTSIFFAKFIFLSIIVSYSMWLFLFFMVIFFLLLPLFFIRLWVPMWFGLHQTTTHQVVFDLTAKEQALIFFSCAINIALGVVPILFFSLF